jgi:hypothetical protein
MTQKIARFGTAALFFATIALALAACANDRNAGKNAHVQDVTQQERSQSKDAGVAVEKDEWRQIKTFAQSIESVGLDFDSKTRVATLAFEYRNVDVMGSDGVPVYTHLHGMQGVVGADGIAVLAVPALPEYSARVKCKDAECLNAKIEITKTSGTIAGAANIRQTTYTQVGTLISTDFTQLYTRGDTTHQVIAKDINSSDPRTVTLKIKEVIDGRKNFFLIRLKFSNILRHPRDDSYFDAKEVQVWGEIGSNKLIQAGQGSSNGGYSSSRSTPYRADVQYDADRQYVGVKFYENNVDHVEEGIRFLAVGRELFAKPKEESK